MSAKITRLVLSIQDPVPGRADEEGKGEEAEMPSQGAGGPPPTSSPKIGVKPLVKLHGPLLQRQYPGVGDRIHRREVGRGPEKNGETFEVLQPRPSDVPRG